LSYTAMHNKVKNLVRRTKIWGISAKYRGPTQGLFNLLETPRT
jgi:hypothetical protein